MSKLCKRCGKEIPETSKYDACDGCQNKENGIIRKVLVGVGTALLTIGSLALPAIIKGIFYRDPEA